MDGERFDRLARALATTGGRRRVLRGMVAAALIGTGRAASDNEKAAAQRTCLDLGQACISSEECCPDAYYPRPCADNGVSEDGALTCCANEQGSCSADAHCCGDRVCIASPLGYDVSRYWCADPSQLSFGSRTALDDLNLRSFPVLTEPVLIVIPAGATVALRGSEAINGYLPVEYLGTLGWAAAEYLV